MRVVGIDPGIEEVGVVLIEDRTVLAESTVKMPGKRKDEKNNDWHRRRFKHLVSALVEVMFYLKGFGYYGDVVIEMPFSKDGKIWGKGKIGPHGPGMVALAFALCYAVVSRMGYEPITVAAGEWRPFVTRNALLASLKYDEEKELTNKHTQDAACVACYWLAGNE